MLQELLDTVTEGREMLEDILVNYGLEFFFITQFISGMGLLFFMPDGVVTPTFLMSYADNLFDLVLVSAVSAAGLVIGNFLLFLFFRFLGERFISEERRTGRLWRFMHWSIKRNSKASMFFFRLLPVGSGLIAIPAGLLNIKTKIFLFYSFLGFFVFELSLSLLTWYGLGEALLIDYFTSQFPWTEEYLP